MSLADLPQPATTPTACIPDHHTATEAQPTYNSSACSAPRPRSLSLSIEQANTLQADIDHNDDSTDGTSINRITDDMLSIHSTKSESFVTGPSSAGAPALPMKSALRASRLLATLPQKLSDDRPVLTPAAPHLMYLSSEEDGSSSADDLSDLDSFDSDSEESLDGHAYHAGEFARAVSVVFSGKPSVINLTSRSGSLASLRNKSEDPALRTTATAPTLGRTRSTSSVASSLRHPPRSSSMNTNMDKRRPKFLHVDPFAPPKEDSESIKAPKTPTAMFSRAFNNLVKKRSRTALNSARDNEVVPMELVGEEIMEEVPEEPVSPKTVAAGPVKYQDIMAAAKKNAQSPTAQSPPTPTSPNSAKNGIRGFSLSRRMSVRV